MCIRDRLKTIEAQFPQLVTPDSPTQHVGGTPSGKFSKVTHAVKMAVSYTHLDVYKRQPVNCPSAKSMTIWTLPHSSCSAMLS